MTECDFIRDVLDLFMTISQDMVGENKGGVHVILITTARYDSLSTRYHCLSCHFHMNLIQPRLNEAEDHLLVDCGEEKNLFRAK